MRASGNTGRLFIFKSVVLVTILLTGCATGPFAPGDPDSAFPMPLATNEFIIDQKGNDVLGELQVVLAREEDTLSDIARRFNVGYEEIVAANPDVDPWLPKAGTEIIIPSQWILPNAKREGIVVNLAAMRLFYFPKSGKNEPQTVITHPVGIGRVGWKTPEGRTRVISKVEAPTWIPTTAIRKEHAENGDPLPWSVPPGPDNPMGTHVLRLGWPEYAIHGTDKPPSIGLRGTHGCLRMYPEDIISMYRQIPVGTPVTVVNEPFLVGFRGDTLMLQTYPVLEDDKRDHGAHLKNRIARMRAAHGTRPSLEINKGVVRDMTQSPRALTMPVSHPDLALDQLLASVPRVKNRLPLNANWDGAGDLEVAQSAEGTVSASNE